MSNGDTYAISGGHQFTVNAAQLILDNGGNAIDAAIAAYWMCMVSEPFMANAGAGGFALIRNSGGQMTAMDFFCQTPKSKMAPESSDLFPITVDFGTTTENFYVGMASVAVPGAIAALWEMHRRWATIPMKELVLPAIEATRAGIVLEEFQSYECQLLECIFELDPRGKAIFQNKDGTLKGIGEKISLDYFPDFAESIAIEGADLFYKGEIAKTIVKLCKEKGGNLTMEDFNAYQVHLAKPFSYQWNGHEVHSNPFPSVGAMIQAAMLKGFENAKISRSSSLEHLKLLTELSKEIYDIKGNLDQLQSHLSAKGIDTHLGGSRSHKWGGTSHFNIVDKDGMAVSLSTSIGEGSGTFIPGTDMQLNNMLGELALLPNGIHSWQQDVRLQSMMCPTMITNPNNELVMQIGSGGAGRIPFAMAQTIYNRLALGMELNEAIGFPRVIYDGSQYQIEQGFEEISSDLKHKLWDTSSLYFGGTHAITKEDGRFIAVGDPRRYGKAFS